MQKEVRAYCIISVISDSLQPYGPTLQTVDARFLCPWDSPGKNTGVGCHFLLQGIFPIQGSNSCLLMSSALWGGFLTTRANWKAAKRRSRWETPIFRRKEVVLYTLTSTFFFFQLGYLGKTFHIYRAVFSSANSRLEEFHKSLCHYLV